MTAHPDPLKSAIFFKAIACGAVIQAGGECTSAPALFIRRSVRTSGFHRTLTEIAVRFLITIAIAKLECGKTVFTIYSRGGETGRRAAQ